MQKLIEEINRLERETKINFDEFIRKTPKGKLIEEAKDEWENLQIDDQDFAKQWDNTDEDFKEWFEDVYLEEERKEYLVVDSNNNWLSMGLDKEEAIAEAKDFSKQDEFGDMEIGDEIWVYEAKEIYKFKK